MGRRKATLGFLLILLGLIVGGFFRKSSSSLESVQMPVMLDHVEMRRVLYDDVSRVTDGVLSASDPRYMNLIYSRLTAPNTKRPRQLTPYENKTLRHVSKALIRQ